MNPNVEKGGMDSLLDGVFRRGKFTPSVPAGFHAIVMERVLLFREAERQANERRNMLWFIALGGLSYVVTGLFFYLFFKGSGMSYYLSDFILYRWDPSVYSFVLLLSCFFVYLTMCRSFLLFSFLCKLPAVMARYPAL